MAAFALASPAAPASALGAVLHAGCISEHYSPLSDTWALLPLAPAVASALEEAAGPRLQEWLARLGLFSVEAPAAAVAGAPLIYGWAPPTLLGRAPCPRWGHVLSAVPGRPASSPAFLVTGGFGGAPGTEAADLSDLHILTLSLGPAHGAAVAIAGAAAAGAPNFAASALLPQVVATWTMPALPKPLTMPAAGAYPPRRRLGGDILALSGSAAAAGGGAAGARPQQRLVIFGGFSAKDGFYNDLWAIEVEAALAGADLAAAAAGEAAVLATAASKAAAAAPVAASKGAAASGGGASGALAALSAAGPPSARPVAKPSTPTAAAATPSAGSSGSGGVPTSALDAVPSWEARAAAMVAARRAAGGASVAASPAVESGGAGHIAAVGSSAGSRSAASAGSAASIPVPASAAAPAPAPVPSPAAPAADASTAASRAAAGGAPPRTPSTDREATQPVSPSTLSPNAPTFEPTQARQGSAETATPGGEVIYPMRAVSGGSAPEVARMLSLPSFPGFGRMPPSALYAPFGGGLSPFQAAFPSSLPLPGQPPLPPTPHPDHPLGAAMSALGGGDGALSVPRDYPSALGSSLPPAADVWASYAGGGSSEAPPAPEPSPASALAYRSSLNPSAATFERADTSSGAAAPASAPAPVQVTVETVLARCCERFGVEQGDAIIVARQLHRDSDVFRIKARAIEAAGGIADESILHGEMDLAMLMPAVGVDAVPLIRGVIARLTSRAHSAEDAAEEASVQLATAEKSLAAAEERAKKGLSSDAGAAEAARAADAARKELTSMRAQLFAAQREGAAARSEADALRKELARAQEAARATASSGVAIKAKEAEIEVLKREVFRAKDALDRSHHCVICEDRKRKLVFLPCRHFVSCRPCFDALPRAAGGRPECPICRAAVTSQIDVLGMDH